MPMTGQNFLINQQEFENGSCVASNQFVKLNDSSLYMRQFSSYSILAIIWFQPRTLDDSDRVLLHFRITLQRKK